MQLAWRLRRSNCWTCGPRGKRRQPPATLEVLLDSRQPSSTEVPMRRIGFPVVLTLSLALAPLAVEGQQAQEVDRIGVFTPVPVAALERASPPDLVRAPA